LSYVRGCAFGWAHGPPCLGRVCARLLDSCSASTTRPPPSIDAMRSAILTRGPCSLKALSSSRESAFRPSWHDALSAPTVAPLPLLLTHLRSQRSSRRLRSSPRLALPALLLPSSRPSSTNLLPLALPSQSRASRFNFKRQLLLYWPDVQNL
jgi:hypothetical protein